jgi:hypothetical protein
MNIGVILTVVLGYITGLLIGTGIWFIVKGVNKLQNEQKRYKNFRQVSSKIMNDFYNRK